MGKGKLEGWAQIEEYLGMTSKTILQHGYPVRRLGRVFAYTEDIDAHRARIEQRAPIVSADAPQPAA